jgi:hypothetical protein
MVAGETATAVDHLVHGPPTEPVWLGPEPEVEVELEAIEPEPGLVEQV